MWGDERRPVSPGPAHSPPPDPYDQNRLTAHLRDVEALTGNTGGPPVPRVVGEQAPHAASARAGTDRWRRRWVWAFVAILGAGVAVLLWAVAGFGAQQRSMLPLAEAWAGGPVRQV
jgi:hypothetical protein